MKLLNIYLIIMYFSMNCAVSQEKQPSPESSAFSFVFNSLIGEKRLLEYNDGFLEKYSINLNGLLNERTVFYSSGSTCFLSRVDKIEDEPSSQYNSQDLNMIRGLNNDRESKEKAGRKRVAYELPTKVEESSLNEFAELGRKTRFLLTVRHHLEFKGTYLVEINATSVNDLQNLAQYIFYVYLNEKMEVIKWNFQEGYDPVTLDICQEN